MSERTDTLPALPRQTATGEGWRLVQTAPGPEAPDVRTDAAARRGMIIALSTCALFWGAVAAGVAFLLT